MVFLTVLSIQVNIVLKIKKALTIINTVKAYYVMLVKREITYAFKSVIFKVFII